MCGSHPRHLYVANELYKAGFLKALVIEKENHSIQDLILHGLIRIKNYLLIILK